MIKNMETTDADLLGLNNMEHATEQANSADKQLEEKLVECIRTNDERKFMELLGPAKAGENHLKQASLRRMSMFTNLTVTAQSAMTGSSG